jgi:hypothetical protein
MYKNIPYTVVENMALIKLMIKQAKPEEKLIFSPTARGSLWKSDPMARSTGSFAIG